MVIGEMDHPSGHHQEIPSESLENMIVCQKAQQERKPRPQPEQALKCPRCDSTNTKFCYYNNYSLSQPRYFCKSCRRYWTKGGTLRNVPVGGGCRKNKRPSSSSASSKKSHDSQSINPDPNPLVTAPPSLRYDSADHHDLSLAFARLQRQQMGYDDQQEVSMYGSSSITNPVFMDAFKSGFLQSQSGAFQSNGYYHYGSGEQVEYGAGDQMGISYDDQMIGSGSTSAVTVTTTKQEMVCNGENRMIWGFPWQINGGDGSNLMNGVESGRENWNGFSSSWHGLLNAPLM